MEVVRAEVDYSQLSAVYKNRSFVGMKGWRYYPFVIEILALRELKVKNRAIADWLNTIVTHEIILNNNTLVAYISSWKTTGMLDGISRELIDEAKTKIQRLARTNSENLNWIEEKFDEVQNKSIKETAENNEKFGFSILDLLKEISKTTPNLSDEEKKFCKSFYDEHKNKLSLEGMRNEIIGEFVKKM